MQASTPWSPGSSSSYGPDLSLTQGSRQKRKKAGSTLGNNFAKPRMCVCVSPLLCSRLHRALGERPPSWEPQVAMTTTAGAHLQSPLLPPTTATLASSWGDTISLMGVSPSLPQATSLSLACHIRKPLDPGEGQGTRQSPRNDSFSTQAFSGGLVLMS